MPRTTQTAKLRQKVEVIETYLEHAIGAEYIFEYARAVTPDDRLRERLHDLKYCAQSIPKDVMELMFLNAFNTSKSLLKGYVETTDRVVRVLKNA